MTHSRQSSDGVRVWTTQPDPRTSVLPERDVLTGRPMAHDHSDKDRARQPRDPPASRRSDGAARPRSGLPSPRLKSVHSASSRGVLVGGALVVALTVVVGVVLVTTSRTPAPVGTAAVVQETIVSDRPQSAQGAGSSSPVGTAPLSAAPSTGAAPKPATASAVPVGSVIAGSVAGRSATTASPPGSGAPLTVSSRPSSTVPPALDPARIWGYRSVYVITEVEAGGDFITVGMRSENIVRCSAGRSRG